MARALTFQTEIQEAIDAGVLSPRQAWALEWDLKARPHEPWEPMAALRLQMLESKQRQEWEEQLAPLPRGMGS